MYEVKIPAKTQKKIETIKALGIHVTVRWDMANLQWNISIGNERCSTPASENESNLDRYVTVKLKELKNQTQGIEKKDNCDNCVHSYISGARLACGLTKMVTVNEHWCIEHIRKKDV